MYNGKHYVFTLPEQDQNQCVWRYMDFWKFADILKTSKLYMSSILRMGDLYEAEVPEYIQEKFIEEARKYKGADYAEGLAQALKPNESFKRQTFISSWNNQTSESFALWKLYTNDSSAVCIKSSIDRLKEAFRSEEVYTQYIGQIKYHNGRDQYFFRGNYFDPVMQKWEYYNFENEIRVVSGLNSRLKREEFLDPPDGIYVNVELEILIDQVYLAPNATQKEYENISALMETTDLNFDICRSGIRDKWINS